MTGVYELAGHIVRIGTVHDAVHRFLRAYSVDDGPAAEGPAAGSSATGGPAAGDSATGGPAAGGPAGRGPTICVTTSSEDIEEERIRSAIVRGEGTSFSDAYYESLAVLRKLSEKIPLHNAFLFHGSALAVDGEAFVFAAPSGTGKSTHARLWRTYLGSKVLMVNDDKPFMRMAHDRAYVCGSPWDGKHHLSANVMVPVRAICLLERSQSNWVRPVSYHEAYPGLLQQTYRPRDRVAMARTLDLLDALSGRIDLYRMGCNMDVEAARMSYETMRGGSR